MSMFHDRFIFNVFRCVFSVVKVILHLLGVLIDASLQVGHDIINIVGVELEMSPYHLLRVVNLIHYQAHQQVYDSVADHIYLDDQ